MCATWEGPYFIKMLKSGLAACFRLLRLVGQCVCVMADAVNGPASNVEAGVADSAPAASEAPASPEATPSEPSSAGGSSASSVEGRPGCPEGFEGPEEEVCPGDQKRHEAEAKAAGQGESAQRRGPNGGVAHAQGEEGQWPHMDYYTAIHGVLVRCIGVFFRRPEGWRPWVLSCRPRGKLCAYFAALSGGARVRTRLVTFCLPQSVET